MTMITPSYLGETIEYSSLHACRSTLEDPTSMKHAGIDFRVCGQGVLGQKIDMSAIMPEVQVDQWAMTTITTLQLRGYIRVQM